ncbi:MAG: transcription antitermination factor NusB [Myxococcales bacterium]|nr:transcription antitermination factor NusB [Myxococcales bacterium]MCB9627071.1 transcription antitermination factor NusB [Sandaracinaceae bacterium]
MGQRRDGRQAALQVLYQMDTVGASAEAALSLYWGSLARADDAPDGLALNDDELPDALDAETRAFVDRLVRGFGERREEIDATIRSVSHHWRIERMTRVDRNILRLATCELMLLDDVPRRVTLNEAIELAKRFGSEGSAGFVNGVLDRIATELQKE